MNYFLQILDIVKQKCEYHQKNNHHERATHIPYLHALREEIQEVVDEIKPNNQVYLEDELGDIIRDVYNIIYTLQEQGYISNTEKVFERCAKKYHERVTDKVNGIDRAETKKRQKKRLQEEHDATRS